MDFRSRISEHQPLLLDGALGTLLQSRGFDLPAPQWSAAVLELNPEIITSVHREYLSAGAEIITTATFRTTTRVYTKLHKPEIAKDLNYRAVQCARDAIGERENKFIAGSIAPLEDCYRPDLVPNEDALYNEHREQIQWLIDAGIDVLLFETMNTIQEAVSCSQIASELEFPFYTSVVCDKPGQLLSSESITELVDKITDLNPLGFLVNCTYPGVLGDTLEILDNYTTIPIGGYANVGESQPEQKGTIEKSISPGDYCGYVRPWLKYNISLVGACCGSTPEHINELHKLLKSV